MIGGWQKKQGVMYLDNFRAGVLAESGVHLAIAEMAADPSIRNRHQAIALDSASQVSYSIQPWGAFLRIKSTGTGHRITRTLTAIVGTQPPGIFDHVLVPIGSPHPLVVSGHTSIHGDVYVGRSGITKGEINGQGFRGNVLVDGSIDFLDPAILPRFSDEILIEFLDSLEALRRETTAIDRSITDLDDFGLIGSRVGGESTIRTRADIELNLPDSTTVKSPQFLFADRTVRITGDTRLRHLVVCSNVVVVSRQSRLEDCIIVADQVHLTDASVFSGQIIVRDTLRIELQASISNPSLILLQGRNQGEQHAGAVSITSNGLLRASVIYGRHQSPDGNEFEEHAGCRLEISDRSCLSGLIWWEGLVEIKGALSGAAAVSLFSHDVQPTTYINWLVDADIRFFDAASSATFPIIFINPGQPKLWEICESRTL